MWIIELSVRLFCSWIGYRKVSSSTICYTNWHTSSSVIPVVMAILSIHVISELDNNHIMSYYIQWNKIMQWQSCKHCFIKAYWPSFFLPRYQIQNNRGPHVSTIHAWPQLHTILECTFRSLLPPINVTTLRHPMIFAELQHWFYPNAE